MEYQKKLKDAREAREMEAYKKAYGANDCPNPDCTAIIEKSEGYNHMQCALCKIHICWVCLEVSAAVADF